MRFVPSNKEYTMQYDIALSNVAFAYHRERILEEVTFTVEHLDFATIVGPNGSGKTTLLKLFLGLLRPTKGTIRILGKSPGKSRFSVGYMPQHTGFDMDFPMTVCELVLMGRLGNSPFGRYSKMDREIAHNALEEVGLADLAEKRIGSLSGGQRQRALLARALCCDPKLLLLDEPTASIDPTTEESLFEIMGRLNKRMTILFVSHDLGFVSQIVKSVVCVNRTVVVHPTSEITGAVIQDIYGDDLRLIRHDHRCSEKGHHHD